MSREAILPFIVKNHGKKAKLDHLEGGPPLLKMGFFRYNGGNVFPKN